MLLSLLEKLLNKLQNSKGVVLFPDNNCYVGFKRTLLHFLARFLSRNTISKFHFLLL